MLSYVKKLVKLVIFYPAQEHSEYVLICLDDFEFLHIYL